MQRYIRLITLLVGTLSLLGCASSKQGQVQLARIPNLAIPLEDSSKARIYFIHARFPGLFGPEWTVKDIEADQVIGVLDPYSHNFLCWERPPGNVTISFRCTWSVDFNIHVEAGRTYYVFMNKFSNIKQIDEESGRKYLKKCTPPQSAK